MPVTTSLVQPLQDLVLEVGDFIRQERKRFSLSDVQSKGGRNNLVSYVDFTAEAKLTEACESLIPGSGFIREEGGDLRADAEYRWIIDPLDGTTNFIQDIPAYCISLALQHREETVLGIVYDIPREEYFLAERGGGATRNGEPIRVSSCADRADALLATGFPYIKNGSFGDYLTVVQKVLVSTRGVRRFGSAALDLAWVACGRLDGYFEMGLNAWDVAAAELLLREAGGQVSDFSGTDNYVFGKQIVGTNTAIHSGILELLRDFV